MCFIAEWSPCNSEKKSLNAACNSSKRGERGFLPERAAELVVVHVCLGLLVAPHLGNLVRLPQTELAAGTLPRDDVPVPVWPREQLEEELPQLDLAGARGGAGRQELRVVVLGYF